jgi:hypothetical protein
MRALSRAFLAGSLLFGGGLVIGIPAVRAQGFGTAGSLGGYGGSMTDGGSGAGMSGVAIPYAGRFGGFMPYRMGGGGNLYFQSRGSSPTASTRPSFRLSPMSGGMGQGFGSSARMSSSFAPPAAMGPGGGMGVMPPSFGYPFRQPPSLLTPTYAGAGMSM